MAKKKKEPTTETEVKESPGQAVNGSETKTEKVRQPAEKRPPQMVTVNGDKVSHAHVYKSKTSDDWFFTAKINDVPLKPQKISKEDLEAVLNKTIKPHELMQTYYPTKLAPKLSPEQFKIPMQINTPNGVETVHKFNVYKEKNQDNVDYNKYRFYAQVGDRKMSEPAAKKDLDAYFDQTRSPKDLITQVFGERLHMADHYKQFKLPEGVNIEGKDISIMKNQATNRYEISADLGKLGKTHAVEMSYDDRQSYFTHKTATKEQLAAKYLSPAIENALQQAPREEMRLQPSLGL